MFDTTVFRDVLHTRYGHVALVRLALLALAFPLLRVLAAPAARGRAPAPRVVVGRRAALVGLGLAVTPGIGGHAGTGIQTGSRFRPTSCTSRRWRAGSVAS